MSLDSFLFELYLLTFLNVNSGCEHLSLYLLTYSIQMLDHIVIIISISHGFRYLVQVDSSWILMMRSCNVVMDRPSLCMVVLEY